MNDRDVYDQTLKNRTEDDIYLCNLMEEYKNASLFDFLRWYDEGSETYKVMTRKEVIDKYISQLH